MSIWIKEMNENEFPLVTVAIAAYNGEKYAGWCGMRSKSDQSQFGNHSGGDGSTDLTPEIYDAIAKEDYRIRVFHNLDVVPHPAVDKATIWCYCNSVCLP